MSWKVKKGDNEGSGSKKRKLDAVGADNDWDDDIGFTQDELEKIDVIASQAILQSQSYNTEGTAIAPPLNPFASSTTTCRNSSSSALKESQLLLTSSSRSNNDRISSNGRTSQTKLEQEIQRTKDERDRYIGEVRYLKDITRSQEVELEKLRAQLEDMKEAQKLAQMSKIQNLESEVERVTFEKQFKDREIEELQRQLQSVQQKLRRLEAQHQKSQQYKTSSSSVHETTKSPEKASPKKVAVQPSPPSKKNQKLLENLPLSQQANFPTYYSFINQSSSQSIVNKTEPVTHSPVKVHVCDSDPSRKLTTKKIELKIGPLQDQGQKIATHLLQTSQMPSDQKGDLKSQIWDPGLIHLLSDATVAPLAPLTSLAISNRKEDGHISTPKLPSKQVNKKSLESLPQIVTREHYRLAVDGLLFLLNDQRSESYLKDLNTTCSGSIRNSTLGETSPERQLFKIHPEQQADEAVYKFMNLTLDAFMKELSPTCQAVTNLLPMLFDYIEHYVKLVEKEGLVLFRSLSSLSSSTLSTPSSIETKSSSSLLLDTTGSLASCLIHLLQGENGHCATGIECLTISSIRILMLILRFCPEVGQVIFKHTFPSRNFRPSKELEEDQMKKSSSSGNADDELSITSTETQIILDLRSPVSRHGQTNFQFYSVIKIARQDLETESTNPLIVNEAVKCLYTLLQCVPKQLLYKLETLLPLQFLSAYFKQTKAISIHLSALKLLASLARCEKLLEKLCSKSDNCPLFLVHRLCSHTNPEALLSEKIAFYQEYISCILELLSHPLGLKLLLTNKCPCTEELVVAVIRALNQVLCFYKDARRTSDSTQHLLETLVHGVHLLHALAQGDIIFVQHSAPVQTIYIRLVIKLERLFRSLPKDYELVLLALEDLSDFDSETAEASQDMETDER
ncbi:serine-rich adhesin for platelets [Biomphalaria glabrata]|nr:serine-rich adhesin for platelets [Biomphalaria glabrata]